jgi:hypothetical protein
MKDVRSSALFFFSSDQISSLAWPQIVRNDLPQIQCLMALVVKAQAQ